MNIYRLFSSKMKSEIINILRWNIRLAAKFLWAAPFATCAVVFFTLVSQLSMLLAFFLPLKVLILLGSDDVPSYFPQFFGSVERDWLIIIMSITTGFFYIFYLLAQRLVLIGGELGANTLMQRGRKLVLFEHQDALAQQAYK